MSCNGYSLCGNGNNSCMCTLIIIAIVFVWLNCFGGCGIGCGGFNNNCCNNCCDC